MVESMDRLAAAGGMPPRGLNFLHYGLGRALENLGEFERSISPLRRSESHRCSEIKFGRANSTDRHTRRTSIELSRHSRGNLNRSRSQVGAGPSHLRIVIVGMMRSGTTLAEQILSSHPVVGAAGEDRFWPKNWRRARPRAQSSMNASSSRHWPTGTCAA